MVQKQRLASIPDVESLKRLSQSLAMLDAILSPDWEFRYYSFNSKWSEGEMMASMRDGSGDDYFILFNSHGAIIKGFAHESPMSPFVNEPVKVWQGVLESVPREFQDFLSEPAFEIEATTFCIWRRYSDSSWQVGDIVYPEENDPRTIETIKALQQNLDIVYPELKDPDGSEDLLSILDGEPSSYHSFARKYFGKEIAFSAVQHIYEHKLLTDEIIMQLNAEVSEKTLREDIEEIGYPNGVA
ncbi:MAG: hypothetical protein M3367_18650 [Acidobacteriota bacterium]|nr:hypothetical protein [Acidobacteriota bacterium]